MNENVNVNNSKDVCVPVSVTSVGNSWIMCRSKTYAGRVYYFNTVTGQAVWNLSEAEVAIAKKKALESSQDILNADFPEPPESPQNIKPAPSRIYNNQIINNRFPRQPYPIFTPVNTIGPFGLSYAPVLNVSSPMVWNQPQVETSPQVKFDYSESKQVNHTSVPLSMRFKNLQNKHNPFNKRYPRKNFNFKRNFRQYNSTNNHIDLRKKLCNMRMKGNLFNGSLGSNDSFNSLHNDNVLGNKDSFTNDCEENQEALNSIGEEEQGIETESTEDVVTDGCFKDFNIAALHKLFNIDPKVKVWYLAVDEAVLLRNLNIVSKIMNSDDRCSLIIPNIVLNEIQKLIISTDKMNHRKSLKAVMFISNILAESRGIIDDSSEKDNHYENVIESCLNHSKNNNQVILLTQGDGFQEHKTDSFPMYSMDEIEHFLEYGKLKETELPQNNNGTITITIHNNIQEYVHQECQTEPINTQIHLEDAKTMVHMFVQTENTLVDASVQTEIESRVSTNNQESVTDTLNKKGTYHKWPRRLKKTSKSIKTSSTPSESSFSGDTEVDWDSNIQKCDPKDENNHVMFEVTNKAMRDYLEMKSEEWISRFVQIIEEVLTQILRHDPPILPPPWSIYEACECIKRKFKNEPDIVDASNKLEDMLFDIGGLRGKIDKNVTPEAYMKMYSLGVYLIDVLQGPLCNNEDLQIAEKSLAKLLIDIQSPHLDPSNCDSFNDIEAHLNDSITKDIQNSEAQETEIQQSILSPVKCSSNPSEEVLSYNKEKCSRNSSPITRKCTSLSPKVTKELEKCSSSSKSSDTMSPSRKYFLRNRKFSTDTIKSKENASKVLHLTEKDVFLNNFLLQNREQNQEHFEVYENIETSHETLNSFNVQGSSPKIIRNFTKCKEFEEKLGNFDIFSEELYDDDLEDYNEEPNMLFVDDSEFAEISNINPIIDEPVENVKVYKHFVNKVATHIKRQFQLVYLFCKDSRLCLMSECNEKEKHNLHTKCKQLSECMDTLCMDLESISKRETCSHSDVLLKLGIHEVTEQELNYYRNFISQCLMEGNVLQNALKLLIEATK